MPEATITKVEIVLKLRMFRAGLNALSDQLNHYGDEIHLHSQACWLYEISRADTKPEIVIENLVFFIGEVYDSYNASERDDNEELDNGLKILALIHRLCEDVHTRIQHTESGTANSDSE